MLRKTLCVIGIIEGNVYSAVFFAWVKQILLPNIPPNSVICMDIASFHKRSDAQELITKASRTPEYLSPYYPDLNPIQQS